MALPENLLPDSPTAIEAREFWSRAKRAVAESELREPDAETALAETFAIATDAASLLISDLDNRPQLRAFVDAVIGATGGDGDFVEVTDEELAKRLGRSTKTIQNYRKDFRKCDAHGLIIEIKDDWRDPVTFEPHAHAYKCKITGLAVEAMQDAQLSPFWSRGKEGKLKACEEAAARVALGAALGALRKPKKRKQAGDAEVMASKLRQATRALSAATARRAMVKNPDFDELWELRGALVASLGEFDAACGFVSTQDQNTDQVETGGVVEKTSTQNDLAESVTYENTETRGGVVEKTSTPTLPPVCVEDAVAAVAAFDAAEFQVTLIDDAKPKGDRAEGFETLSKADFADWLPYLLKRSAKRGESVIVRPVASNLIQLDDLDRAGVELVEPYALATVETSRGNFQAWLALSDPGEREGLRRRLILRCGADRGASGALRFPGSINFKPGRDRFTVKLQTVAPGRTTTAAELEAAELLAPVSPNPSQSQPPKLRVARAPRQFPDYDRCVREAKRRPDGSADMSDADKNWCILALDRGWSEAETGSKLCELRDKARRRPDYARRTVEYAASVVNSRA